MSSLFICSTPTLCQLYKIFRFKASGSRNLSSLALVGFSYLKSPDVDKQEPQLPKSVTGKVSGRRGGGGRWATGHGTGGDVGEAEANQTRGL